MMALVDSALSVTAPADVTRLASICAETVLLIVFVAKATATATET
jgi:hypothetical protein